MIGAVSVRNTNCPHFTISRNPFLNLVIDMPVATTPKVVFHKHTKFDESMHRLKREGGAQLRAYRVALEIIDSLEHGQSVENKMTNHGENRINHCVKYDLGGAHRLVTVHSGNCIFLLFAGTHDATDAWLDRNRGLTISIDNTTKKISITTVTTEEQRRDAPRLNLDACPEENTPYFDRIEVDPAEFVPSRILLRTIRAVNDSTTDAELEDLLQDLNEAESEVANMLMDVIFLVREGKMDGAKARVQLHREQAIPVQDAEDQGVSALVADINSDSVFVLTGLNQKQLEDLFSPQKFNEWMLFLHPDQKRIVEDDYEGAAVLSGVSGSGKTCILVHRAVRLARRYPWERVGVMTLNRSLCRLIENQITELCALSDDGAVPQNLVVMAFYDYFASLSRELGPQAYIEELRQLASSHPDRENILQTLDTVRGEVFARETDPLSGEDLEETFRIFLEQPRVRTLMTYFQEHLFKYDSYIDPDKYLLEEFSLIRSALPTLNRDKEYMQLERRGRGIAFPPPIRRHALELLLLFEETMLHGGLMDEIGLTLSLTAHRNALAALNPDKRFRCLLIDEFQDFSTRDFTLLRLIPTARENGLFLAGDTVQKVLVKDLRLHAVALGQASANHISIRRNYRNSRQILRAAAMLAETYGKLAKESGEDVEVLDPELALRETGWPHAVQCAPGTEIDEAWKYAAECMSVDSAVPWSICLITASPETIPPEAIELRKPEGLEVEVGRITGDYIRHRDSICVGTMADVKGFDFSLVLIIGCGEKSLPNPGHCQKEAWRDALRLYVAMTRARDEVRFFYEGEPSPFLETMNDGIVWEQE